MGAFAQLMAFLSDTCSPSPTPPIACIFLDTTFMFLLCAQRNEHTSVSERELLFNFGWGE